MGLTPERLGGGAAGNYGRASGREACGAGDNPELSIPGHRDLVEQSQHCTSRAERSAERPSGDNVVYNDLRVNDPLRADIQQALAGRLDPNVFEECACSLLRDEWPSLVPVPGGDDAGVDGLVATPDGLDIGLVCTASKAGPLDNLRRSLTRHKEMGGCIRRVIFATPRTLTPRRQRNLAAAARELGFDLVQVYQQQAFVDRLYHSPEWRKQLLGLSGAPSALSEYPRVWRPMVGIPLIGRSCDLEALGASVGDLVVEGQPGVGKTFLLQALVREGWGLFSVDDDREKLADAIRKLKPCRVIVDDAHFAPEELTSLLQLRKEIAADFAVVATTWPGRRTGIERILDSSTTVVLQPLPRDEILQVVTEVGVAGPTDLQRRIVDQALGRPGLAATLAQLCLRGNVTEVATGEALMRDTLSAYRRAIGDQSSSVLGVLALSGDGGIRLETVSDVLRLDLATVTAVVRDLASAGTIDEAPSGRIRVQPEALRYALVRETFFEGPGRLDVRATLEVFSQPTSAVRPLVGAAHLGARVERALLEKLLNGCSECGAFAWYATLGQKEAVFALEHAGECRAEVAAAALESDSAPEPALHALMALAVGDERPRHNHPDHPMRMIQDYVLAPTKTMTRRMEVRRAVATWLDQGGNSEAALEAMSYALRPGVHSIETDPGRGMTVTIREGPLSLEDLGQLGQLWEPYVELLTTGRIENFGLALRALEDWCYPGRVTMGRGVSDEWVRFAKRRVASVIRKLAGRLEARPGARAALRRLSDRAGLRVRIDEDREFQVLFPVERLDWRAAQARWSRDTRRLAREWARLRPQALAERLVRYEREATMVGITWPRQTPELCEILAQASDRPSEYVAALRKQAAPLDLLHPFLVVLVHKRVRGWEACINEFLDDERVRPVAVNVCLTAPVGQRLSERAVELCDGRMSNLLRCFPKEKLNPDAKRPLLEHRDTGVAQAAVIALRPAPGEGTSDDLGQAWEAALVRCPADEYWYAEMLKDRRDLLVRWILAWSQRLRGERASYERVPEAVLALIGSLELEARIDLLQRVRSHGFNLSLDEVLSAAVGGDERATRALLSRHDLANNHHAALVGLPDEGWFRRAAVMFDAGWSPDKIVASCRLTMSSWMGDESAHWNRYVGAFAPFVDSPDPRVTAIARAGVDYYRRLVDKATEEERREAVHGLK